MCSLRSGAEFGLRSVSAKSSLGLPVTSPSVVFHCCREDNVLATLRVPLAGVAGAGALPLPGWLAGFGLRFGGAWGLAEGLCNLPVRTAPLRMQHCMEQ